MLRTVALLVLAACTSQKPSPVEAPRGPSANATNGTVRVLVTLDTLGDVKLYWTIAQRSGESLATKGAASLTIPSLPLGTHLFRIKTFAEGFEDHQKTIELQIDGEPTQTKNIHLQLSPNKAVPTAWDGKSLQGNSVLKIKRVAP